MNASTVSLLDGSTFVVSSPVGDVEPGGADAVGLFFRDTRHLSNWCLRVDGHALGTLSTNVVDYHAAAFFLVVPTGTIYRNPTLSVARRRFVGDGMRERLTLTNNGAVPEAVTVSLHFDADFADLFEVKDQQALHRTIDRATEGNTATLSYRRGDFLRETRVSAPGATVTPGSATWVIALAPQQSWSTEVEVSLVSNEHRPAVKPTRHHDAPQANMAEELDQWLAGFPRLTADWDDLRHTYDQSMRDLAALRFYPEMKPGTPSLPAAGLPWFMALFGRDSLLTSYQALPFAPELARTTLHALAAHQAQAVDGFRDAEPGKILHEVRFGELTHFHDRPQSPYYGAADTTPLFLVLLDEYERWTGDTATVEQLEPHARAALQWLDTHGDRDGDGYIEYQAAMPRTGLANQCWKDSWNSIVHPDGTLAALPRATCELQGYAYDARVRSARLARDLWHDDELAERLLTRAAQLRAQFNVDFWVEDGGFFALALDGGKRQVRTLASNMGQLLWSGIVEERRVAPVVAHLMAEPLFSGWGVRTLASGQAAYNPIEYHNGTVWPHDNALIAAGLARHGYRTEAGRIGRAVLEAARHFQYRLPEVFAGFPRAETDFPVEYPTACSPQAWATGAPLLILRTELGMEPADTGLVQAPRRPSSLGAITLTGIPGRWGWADAAV